MKKKLIMIIPIIIVFLFSSCSNDLTHEIEDVLEFREHKILDDDETSQVVVDEEIEIVFAKNTIKKAFSFVEGAELVYSQEKNYVPSDKRENYYIFELHIKDGDKIVISKVNYMVNKNTYKISIANSEGIWSVSKR
ncbi:hypothetical protein [uncultured Clostridium sp.]|uniref:hypothetical protein n=1 Tax=uncultured Clostridium sp. TaxID=59620 RepID=UPI00262AEE4A|nr:hypothetical protein [uncultured Clostridium sp.]